MFYTEHGSHFLRRPSEAATSLEEARRDTQYEESHKGTDRSGESKRARRETVKSFNEPANVIFCGRVLAASQLRGFPSSSRLRIPTWTGMSAYRQVRRLDVHLPPTSVKVNYGRHYVKHTLPLVHSQRTLAPQPMRLRLLVAIVVRQCGRPTGRRRLICHHPMTPTPAWCRPRASS